VLHVQATHCAPGTNGSGLCGGLGARARHAIWIANSCLKKVLILTMVLLKEIYRPFVSLASDFLSGEAGKNYPISESSSMFLQLITQTVINARKHSVAGSRNLAKAKKFLSLAFKQVAREVELRQYSRTKTQTGLAERSKWNEE
jgi:hypothetical protein